MRLTERQKIAAEKAKAIMPPSIYAVFAAAIAAGAAVNFIYTNRFGVKKTYWNEYPHSFFETPETFEEYAAPLPVPIVVPVLELPVVPAAVTVERVLSADAQAKLIMPPSIYAVFAAAIAAGAAVNFIYTNRFGVKKTYWNEYPHSFFVGAADSLWPGAVFLWSRRYGATIFKQYRVERITGAQRLVTLIEALLDPSGKAEFWSGATQIFEEVIL